MPPAPPRGRRPGPRPARPATGRATGVRRRRRAPRGWWRGRAAAGQARSSVWARRAHASTRCSQLSSTSSVRFARSTSTSWGTGGRAGSRHAQRRRPPPGTRAGSVSGASSTSHTPSGWASTASAAACRARRVLPVPPGPVSVSRRCVESRRATSASSRSRPTKLVSCTGQVVRAGVQAAQRREVGRQVRVQQLRHPLGLLQVLQPVLSQVAQGRARRAGRPAPARPTASESTTCPPWAVAVRPGAAVQRRPEVVGPLALHLPVVEAHPRRGRGAAPQSSWWRARCPATAAATAAVGRAKAA